MHSWILHYHMSGWKDKETLAVHQASSDGILPESSQERRSEGARCSAQISESSGAVFRGERLYCSNTVPRGQELQETPAIRNRRCVQRPIQPRVWYVTTTIARCCRFYTIPVLVVVLITICSALLGCKGGNRYQDAPHTSWMRLLAGASTVSTLVISPAMDVLAMC